MEMFEKARFIRIYGFDERKFEEIFFRDVRWDSCFEWQFTSKKNVSS